jgi:hypothetical protein
MSFTVKAALVIGSLMISSSVLAATPYPNLTSGGGKWRITAYNDTTTGHSQLTTHELCFSNYTANGTGVTGNWGALTFSSWDGRYYQEGDKLRMTGDFGSNSGHDHMTCEFISASLVNCIWDEWLEQAPGYGTIIGWARAKMERIGTCTVPGPSSAAVPERLTVDGESAASPIQKGLESIQQYKLRTGNE